MSSWKALAVRRRAALGVGCFGARLTTALFKLTFFLPQKTRQLRQGLSMA